MEFIDMNDVKELNRKAGYFWFSPDTTRFFKAKYPQTACKVGDKAYFITSEQFEGSRGYKSPRMFTIRVCDLTTGDVDTVGEFQEYKSRQQAEAALDRILPAG